LNSLSIWNWKDLHSLWAKNILNGLHTIQINNLTYQTTNISSLLPGIPEPRLSPWICLLWKWPCDWIEFLTIIIQWHKIESWWAGEHLAHCLVEGLQKIIDLRPSGSGSSSIWPGGFLISEVVDHGHNICLRFISIQIYCLNLHNLFILLPTFRFFILPRILIIFFFLFFVFFFPNLYFNIWLKYLFCSILNWCKSLISTLGIWSSFLSIFTFFWSLLILRLINYCAN
jgi:hypothetical protein